MKTQTHSLEIHPDFDRDPESRKLERLPAAESGIHIRRQSLVGGSSC
jgi:hypothetical protein